MERLRTYELHEGHTIKPIGTILEIDEMNNGSFLVLFDSGKEKELRRNTKWWVESPSPENEEETEVVSHRRRAPENTNPHGYEEDGLAWAKPDADLPVAHYAQNFQIHSDAAEKAVTDARLISASNPDQAVLFLHEATVRASLAQAHATMASAMATQGAGVEIAVKEM